MASQTITLASSFTPKLATFNSPIPTLLPRSFSCSCSLPTPCLRANYGLRSLRASHFNHFKCYVSPTGESEIVIGGWEDIPDVESNTEVQLIGQACVDDYNEKKGRIVIEFIRVFEGQRDIIDKFKYKLKIEGEEKGEVKKKFEALVIANPLVKSFNQIM